MGIWRMKMRFRMAHFAKQVRSNIIYGFFLLLPAVASIFIIVKLFQWMDSWLYHVTPKSLLTYIHPGMGIVLLLLITYFLGLTARNYIGKRLLHIGNALFVKIPFVNKIYGVVKQVVDAVASPKKKVLDRVVLVEFPRPGLYSLGFITSTENSAVSQSTGERMISVFVPKVPNPTAGFLLYLTTAQVRNVDISMETAIKLIMSAGVVTPDKKEPEPQSGKMPDLTSLLRIFKFPKKGFHDPRD